MEKMCLVHLRDIPYFYEKEYRDRYPKALS